MKLIIQQLLDFIRIYTIKHWIILIIFCSFSVYMNYGRGLQDKINLLQGFSEFLAYFILYAVHTLFAYFLYCFSSRDYRIWTRTGFIFLLIFAFAVFSFRAIIWQHRDIIESLSPPGQIMINRIVFNDIFRLLYLFIPVGIYWFFNDRTQMPLYGISKKNHKPEIYWIMLLCMIPLIAGASALGDFLDYYPRFRKLYLINAPISKILLFEFCYGLDFTSIELFFRGFLVIGFIRYAGMHAILPMAVFYLSIHYGKPIGEAISSFFGGCILGVIAFHSRSIYGGIMIHVGIAWLMELGGWLGNIYRGYW